MSMNGPSQHCLCWVCKQLITFFITSDFNLQYVHFIKLKNTGK